MKRTRWIVLAALLGLVGGCVRNPATGRNQLNLVSEAQEIELGRQAAAQVEQEIGLYPDPEVQAYVNSVGQKIAARSERPKLPWSFKVVDDAAVNAFALPGGFVFVTRGLMTYMSSEAELAAVLGHEAGHVTARHSVNMLSKAQLAELGLGVGMIIKPGLRKLAPLASGGLQLLFLKFSRDAEDQADELSLGYLGRTGYQAGAVPSLLALLGRQGALEGQGRLPTFLATHPEPAARVAHTEKLIAQRGINPRAGAVERDRYLASIDGMTFGEDPRQGYFHGATFVQPEMRVAVDLPSGWKSQNTPSAVAAVSPNQDAAIELQVSQGSSPERAAQELLGAQGVQASAPRAVSVHGLRGLQADFVAQDAGGGAVQGSALFVEHGGRTFALLAYAAPQRAATYAPTFERSLGSIRPEDDPKLVGVQPARIRLEQVRRAETLREFQAAQPSTISLDRLAVMNQVQPSTRLAPGTTLKRVVGGQPEQG